MFCKYVSLLIVCCFVICFTPGVVYYDYSLDAETYNKLTKTKYLNNYFYGDSVLDSFMLLVDKGL